jgi:hypothetical protein
MESAPEDECFLSAPISLTIRAMISEPRPCDACATGPAVRLYEESASNYLLQLMVCEECYELLDRVGMKGLNEGLKERYRTAEITVGRG